MLGENVDFAALSLVMPFAPQHRMRPEIASLLTPHIYEQLENHLSVFDYDHIKVCLAALLKLYFMKKKKN